MKPILEPGRNCWRIEAAERASLLVDGAAYFKALRESLKQAQKTVLILAWDLDSRLRMTREEDQDDGWPTVLGELLQALVVRKPELNIYILSWDFAMIFALDREWSPIYKVNGKTHRRLHHHMDDCHPMSASHHQKVVVIDDKLAFVGGLDLTMGRWDTPEHNPDDKRRRELGDEPPRPYHDVQMAVTGDVARALGHMARERWQRATNRELQPPVIAAECDPWPAYLTADLENIDVAIARTQPEYEDWPEVRENERLYLDAIAAAQDWIYLENQYFTCASIADALAARLNEADGPEVVIVLPLKTQGWLSQATMDVLRQRLLKQLVAADHGGRLRIFYPHIPGLGESSINVHSKLMIVDDDFIRVGSSNLNNRSMHMDTECDLAIESGGESRNSSAIARLRHRLVGEHLDVAPEALTAKMEQTRSLVATIEHFRGEGRSLRYLDLIADENVPEVLSVTEAIDPEQPIDPSVLVRRLVPDDERKPARTRIIGWGLLLVAVLALGLAWKWTPLSEWLHPDTLAQALEPIKNSRLAPLLVMAGFVLAGLIVMPLTVLIIAVVLSFGPWAGFAYSLGGALLSATVLYGLGTLIGRAGVRRLAGTRLNRISRQLAQRGILTILIVRIVPVAPFTLVNLVAGASHVKFRDYVIGTLLGMTPGMLAIVLVIERIGAVVSAPSLTNLATLLAVIVIAAIVIFYLVKWLRRNLSQRD